MSTVTSLSFQTSPPPSQSVSSAALIQWKHIPFFEREEGNISPLNSGDASVRNSTGENGSEDLDEGPFKYLKDYNYPLTSESAHSTGSIHITHPVPPVPEHIDPFQSMQKTVFHSESCKVFESGKRITSLIVVKSIAGVSSRGRSSMMGVGIPNFGRSVGTSSDDVVVIIAASQELSKQPLIKIIQYDPTVAAASKSPQTSKPPSTKSPFTVLKVIKPEVGKTSSTRRMSISGNNNGSSDPSQIEFRLGVITAMTISPSLSPLIVGFSSGSVLLIKGDVLRDRNVKQKVLVTEGETVTGLKYRDDKATGSSMIYVSTSNDVSAIILDGKDNKVVFDHHGCNHGCATMTNKGEFLVGRNEAVYLYTSDGRGPCFILQGSKTHLSIYNNYLVTLCHDTLLNRYTVSVYDIRNKFIAYSGNFGSVKAVLDVWGSVCVVTGEGKLFRLVEKSIQSKLSLLYQRELFALALKLIQPLDSGLTSDKELISDIYKRWGDALYSKGDYDGAMQQYLQTIGHLEPSHVIRKFLDAQRIPNLILFLQTLHTKGIANSDHTTLLLNCYTKMKDVKSLDDFLKSDEELTFDVETAIKVCRNAGYFQHAVYLAEKYEEHDWYLRIQLDDLGNYNDALAYINRLPSDMIKAYIKQYGKTFINNIPEATTELLIKLNSNSGQTKNEVDGDHEETLPEHYIHLYTPSESQTASLTRFLEFLVQQERDRYQDEMSTDNQKGSELVWNTLLEVYLMSKSERKRRDQVMSILKDPKAHYDINHALVLCKMYNFTSGMLYLYEKLDLYKDILQLYIDTNDFQKVIQAALQYGSRDPTIWIQVLSFFGSKHDECEKELTETLNNILFFAASIFLRNIISPLQVIQVLGRNKSTKIKVVKDYITRRLRVEEQLLQEDKNITASYKSETENMRKQIEELETKPITFQASHCTACSAPLRLPAVHFMCKDSYHLSCLNENERECPKCATKTRMMKEIKRTLADSANDPDLFYGQLGDAEDGFHVIADWFSKKAILSTKEQL
ncbi:hypothetical protein BKA69DRAFT_1127735 [Paraphysoderma sedebokerense]|nr:hypothetical protein BKA69DRAFT_1127735 [Paraphysoderma sedebokerense]